MNYNQSRGRRGKPTVLDPSIDTTPSANMPTTMPDPYSYNQQVPMNNGMPADYGFNVPNQGVGPGSPAYGFNQQPPPAYQPSPVQTFTPSVARNDGFSTGGAQFATQLLAEPLVQNMAMSYGNALANSGKQQFERFVPITALRYYFAVDTDYVFMKLILLFFPFTHKDWSIRYEQDGPLQPRYEKNAPDMYIPMMAFLTYVVVAGLALGTQEKFTPEQLGITASSALAWGVFELIVHIATLYIMSLETSLRYLDLLAYCSYKYVGINAALLVSLVFKKTGFYIVYLYYSLSLAFFLIRSLKLRVIPEGNGSYSARGNKRRLYFILFVAGIQPVLMWWLSYHLI
ncbi:protein YIF1B-A isoform X2 [Trichogramma pretiosum]|uniref:protein YIF1B-A isoform X2 n=1 Tax=Trichogramma pretiosum TaxID=7493 RepID=UPI0006C95174|nr:protein YIF1B-A isoform X2 [Trichogramma pretiosum]